VVVVVVVVVMSRGRPGWEAGGGGRPLSLAMAATVVMASVLTADGAALCSFIPDQV
jgi:hypothetical protein